MNHLISTKQHLGSQPGKQEVSDSWDSIHFKDAARVATWRSEVIGNLPRAARFDGAMLPVLHDAHQVLTDSRPVPTGDGLRPYANELWDRLKSSLLYVHITSSNSIQNIKAEGLKPGKGVISKEDIMFLKELDRRLDPASDFRMFTGIMEKCETWVSLALFLREEPSQIALKGAEKVYSATRLMQRAEARLELTAADRERIDSIRVECDRYVNSHRYVVLGVRGAVLEQAFSEGPQDMHQQFEHQARYLQRTTRGDVPTSKLVARLLFPGPCPVEFEVPHVEPSDIEILYRET